MNIRRLESLLFQEHVVKAGQDHARYGYDSTLVTAALLDTVILVLEIRVLFVLDSSKCALNQQRFQISTSS